MASYLLSFLFPLYFLLCFYDFFTSARLPHIRFDLTQYAGKTIQRYTYAVKNFPGLQENIWASLLLYQDQVVGGEVYSNQGDGFMQGLAYPAKQ